MCWTAGLFDLDREGGRDASEPRVDMAEGGSFQP